MPARIASALLRDSGLGMMENGLTETEGLTLVVQWCLGSLQGMIDGVVHLVGRPSNG